MEQGTPETRRDVILSRIRKGEREAFEDLVNETWDDLVEHLAWILGAREAAEDASQEALIRVWEHRGRWREGSARALVFRIGRNVAFDVRRRERTRRDWVATQRAEGIQGSEGPDELAESSEYERRFREALASLAPGRREVIELVRLRGLKHQEVAEILEISQQTVANRMSLALADLRVLLADILPDLLVDRPSSRRRETDDG